MYFQLCLFALILHGVSAVPVSSASQSPSVQGSFPAVPTDCSSELDSQLPSPTPSNFFFSGNVRTYFVAAEQVAWNYAPSGWDNWLGVPIADSPRAKSAGYLDSIGGAGGLEFQKALYRGYTDSSFTKYSQQAPTNGIQGPTLRAEVGDLVQVYFRNKLPTTYASIHSMGLSYSKGNEGAIYANTTTGQSPRYSGEDAVPPGSCVVYKWFVTPASAPPADEISQAWSYHSYVNMRSDIDAGLIGPFIVYKPGQMARAMAEYREFPIHFNVFNEANSMMAGINAETYGNSTLKAQARNSSTTLNKPYSGNETIWQPQLVNIPAISLSSTQAPKFYTINGFVFANGDAFQMCQDDHVIWYYYAFGSSSHAFHLHGNNYKLDGIEKATKSANDGEMYSLFMQADLPGVWQALCHVDNHQDSGMEIDYKVYPVNNCPLNRLKKG